MENYSYSSYPDSVNSSPRSREIDCENAPWDEAPSSNYKVKFMCSYGGKIQPRSHDNQLTYVGGETKILSVDRNIRFSNFMSKLSTLYEVDVCFKYQLPGEDLDALISVTNDEDLEHMMLEYDRLQRGPRGGNKPARLRLFLFPFNSPAGAGYGSTDSKSESQWFVDVLNSVQIQNLESNPQPVASVENSADFLFGSDKAQQKSVAKITEPVQLPQRPDVPEVYGKEFRSVSECGSEDRHVMGEPVVSPAEIQRQIHELQRLHISNQEQAMYNNRKTDEQNLNPRVYPGEYYQPKAQIPTHQHVTNQAASLWQERHIATGPYPAASEPPPVYLVQTPAGVYQAQTVGPVTGQVGQPYYGMQRVVPEFYREQPLYGTVPPASSFQQTNISGGVHKPEVTFGMVRTAPPPPDPVYAHVSYDSVGRQVYYTAPAGINVIPQPLQHPDATAAAEADVRHGGGTIFTEGKIMNKP